MEEVRLIDANKLRDKRKNATVYTHERYGCEVIEYIDIINAPTIDPESLRPKGRWEMRGGKRYCTNCRKRACVTRDTDDFWYTAGTDFCPSCGAKMGV